MGILRHLLGQLKGPRLAVAIFFLGVTLVLFSRAAGAAYVEILWQQNAGYPGVFWRRVLWSWGTRALAGTAVAGLVFLNLRIAATSLGGIHIRRRFGNIEISEQLPSSWVSAGALAASVILGMWFGAAIPPNLGIQILTLLSAQPWGTTDPILGRDLGYYVFTLPVLASGVTFALVVAFLVFTLAVAVYATTGALRWNRNRLEIRDLARLHLGSLVAVILLLVSARLWIGRPLLLLDGNSAVQGIFGFADAQARLPGLQTLTLISVAAAGGVVWGVWRNAFLPVAASILSVLIGGVVITQIYPSVVQRFQVEPNELSRETPYIEHALRFTRDGFDLSDIRRQVFDFTPDTPVDRPATAEYMAGLPVWTRNTLLQTYQSLEARFPYYVFSDITVDRYDGPAGPSVVAVAVREVDPGGIQDASWQNLHLRDIYVRGFGAVVSRATSRSPQGRPETLLSGIPPERSEEAADFTELRLDRPEIYFGATPQLYALVGPQRVGEDGQASGEPLMADEDLPRGIGLGSRFRTALLAWRFQDMNLFFASDLTPGTRLIHRRQVQQRVSAVAPFLRFPEAPYAVLFEGRMVWVLEGFTGTRAFPLSTVHEFGPARSQVGYVRNSVKVTVDALTGEMAFYRVPAPDPLADAYEIAFPDLLRPMEEMPAGLRDHIRYSRALLDVQSRVLLQYHQETASVFHGQQDVWSLAQEQAESTNPVRYAPEYGLYPFPGDEEPRFNLTTVFVPAGRQNLTGVLAGRTDPSGAPELDLLDVRVEDQVSGPRQIEALVEQDPGISQQFSLWRSGGSEVWTGHLHLLPVGGRMLYMEAVFLAAESEAIPELQRFLVSDGRRVVMTETLSEALTLLTGEEALTVRPVSTPTASDPSSVTEGVASAWPREALELLERAEARAREGDWRGFGDALAELRAFLEELDGPAP